MRKLYRSQENKKWAGVSAGLGEYFDVDPVIPRIVFVATTLAGGFGLLAYIIAWIIVPVKPRDE